MNNKAFTLIELLAVIIVLSLLMVIAVPTISSVTKTTRESAYETKVKNIISAAKLYGQDNYGLIKNKTNSQLKIKVSDLISKEYLSTASERNASMYEDPRNPGSNLNNCEVTITALDNKDVSVQYNVSNNTSC